MIHQSKGNSASFKLVTIAIFLFLSTTSVIAQKAKEYCNQTSRGNIGNGYHYELWTAGGGDVCMTVFGEDAKFKVKWEDIDNMVSRVGLKYDETKTDVQLGTFSADYAFNKSEIVGQAFIGVYGWMVNPLVEYYIVEDWGDNRPSFSKKATVTIDGAEYDIMTATQENKPSIKGTATFTQWWSVRKTQSQSGHISVSKHFDAWKKEGAKLGGLYEVKLKAEGYYSSGTVEFTKAKVELNKPTNVSFVPQISHQQSDLFTNRNASGVLSIIALNGNVVKSVRLKGSESPEISKYDLAPGVYFLRSGSDGSAPVIRPFYVK